MFEQLFPNGVVYYLLGGILVGLGIVLNFYFTGIIGGVSSFFSTTWSYFSQKFDDLKAKRVSRLYLASGMVLGGVVYLLFNGRVYTTELSWLQLFIGGLFVGFGARYSGGCTSGHGICGVSHGSKGSILSVITFLLVAIVVANLIRVVFG